MKNVVFYTFLFLLLVKESFQQNISSSEIESEDSLRLPKNLRPIHYLVRLQPFLGGNFSIDGYVQITFDVDEATDKIVLHIDDILTKNETVKVYSIHYPDTLIAITNQTYDRDKQFYVAHMEEWFDPLQSYVISMQFTAYLNDNMKGFYRSSYEDVNGNTIWLAATQFEPTDARKSFPCFDEPEYKAEFTVEIARREGYRAISNMPKADTIPAEGEEGWFWDKFNTSVPMPTYLVAFVVSDLDFVHSDNNSSLDYVFRVWARKEAMNTTDYAMQVGVKVSKFFEEFLEVPFSLPKQDMVAIPDFPATAMENWGLVLYRENYLLSSPFLTSAYDRMMIGTVICHELAHMWFGNLVSPVWWTHIWLNEGFARYFEFVGLHHFDPSMKILDQILINDFQPALQQDCLHSSHPLKFNQAESPDQINAIFDVISYSKGASILRMLSSFLGEETFKNGLTNYLTDLSYLNAHQDDLYHYLTEQAHVDGALDSNVTVKEIMDTWTLQAGYPVVNIARNQNGSLIVSQTRFVLNSTNGYNSRWWIPLTFTTSSDADFLATKPQRWLRGNETEMIYKGAISEEDEWFVFDVGASGFLRVNYDQRNWDAIAEQLMRDHTAICSLDRARIIDDAFNLARAGQLTYSTALKMIGYMKNEEDFVPLKTSLNNLQYIADMLSQDSYEDDFKKVLRSFIVPLYDRTGFADDLTSPHLEQRIRAEVVALACQIGHQPCVNSSIKLFNEWMQHPDDDTLISPNVKTTVLCVAIGAGGDREWKFVLQQFQKTDLATDKMIILNALGCSPNGENLKEILSMSMRSEVIRKHHSTAAIVSVANNDAVGLSLAWDFFREEWLNLVKYCDGSFMMSELVSGVTGKFKTKEMLDQLNAFRDAYSDEELSTAKRAVEQAVEIGQNNLSWMQNYLSVIQEWIQRTIRKEL